MLKKLACTGLIMALLLTIGGTSAFARSATHDNPEPGAAQMPANNSIKKTESSTRLRVAMDQLVAEAKAGKLTRAERSQIQPAKSNGLSKTTKIAIGVGIAAAVIAIIVIYQHDHALDNLRVF
ncbi:MAG TPA: hypothetical protein VJU86_23380 [Pyrinomonadaceae bacterium]|nr:hypothetical protein [Pyrinomonadaceae bacterium]